MMASAENQNVASNFGLSVGDLVEAHSLQSTKELNGRWGRIVSFADNNLRYGVKLDGLKDATSIKLANLKIVVMSELLDYGSSLMPAAFMESTPGTPVFRLLLRLLPAEALLALTCCQVSFRKELQGADAAWEQAVCNTFGGSLALAQRRCPRAVRPRMAFDALATIRRNLKAVEVVHGELPHACNLGVEALVVPTDGINPYGDAATAVFKEAGRGFVEHITEMHNSASLPGQVGTAYSTPGFGFGVQSLVHVVSPNPSTLDADRKMHKAYAAALERVLEQGHRSVALGALPIGNRGVQLGLTPHIAVEEIRTALARLQPFSMLRIVILASTFDLKQEFRSALAKIRDRVNEDLLEILPVIVLDSMLPRQRLTFDVQQLPAAIHSEYDRFAMIGVQQGPQGTTRIAAGVEVVVRSRSSVNDSMCLEVVGGRRFRLPGVLQREDTAPDSQGRFHFVASVQWTSEKEDKPPTKSELKISARMAPLVNVWLSLVRAGRERQSNQMGLILEDLGPMPPSTEITNRALWVAALINPLPGLGVAWEIRPRMLLADSASDRLEIAMEGLRASIARLWVLSPMR